ncbi:hypothetical protein N8380_08230, partial [Planktomarina temperata]|nr:hypothetical protein [Planktomarina temperata]
YRITIAQIIFLSNGKIFAAEKLKLSAFSTNANKNINLKIDFGYSDQKSLIINSLTQKTVPFQPRFSRPCNGVLSALLPIHNAGNHSAI